MDDQRDNFSSEEKDTERAAASCPPPANTRARKSVRLPARARINDGEGKQIGTLKSGVWYDEQGEKVGEFLYEEEGWKLNSARHGDCYLDGNENIFTTDERYVASLNRLPRTLVAACIAAIVTLLAAFIALLAVYFSQPRTVPRDDYAPTLFLTGTDGSKWEETENLPIFFNDRFGDSIIAPGMSGSYFFRFENANADALEYSLSFAEGNEYGIELCYRLKRDGAYVSGGAGEEGYLRPNELGVTGLTIEARSAALFELEWFWRHNDAVDTAAGESGGTYTFSITLTAQVK